MPHSTQLKRNALEGEMEHIIVYQSGKEVKVCSFEFMHTILTNDGHIKIKDGRKYFYIDQRNE